MSTTDDPKKMSAMVGGVETFAERRAREWLSIACEMASAPTWTEWCEMDEENRLALLKAWRAWKLIPEPPAAVALGVGVNT